MFDGRKNLDYTSNHTEGEGIFWIYGDSLSYYFFESFSKAKAQFCTTSFKMCNVSYNWIYPKTLYELVSYRTLRIVKYQFLHSFQRDNYTFLFLVYQNAWCLL